LEYLRAREKYSPLFNHSFEIIKTKDQPKVHLASLKVIYLSCSIFYGIRYNSFLNYTIGFIAQFYITKILSAVIDDTIAHIIQIHEELNRLF
jgi:hypothetical protein